MVFFGIDSVSSSVESIVGTEDFSVDLDSIVPWLNKSNAPFEACCCLLDELSGAAVESGNNLFNRVLNSSSTKSFSVFSLSAFSIIKAVSSNSIGTLISIVAKRFDNKAFSLLFSTFSFCFPFSSCVLANKPSMLPYF